MLKKTVVTVTLTHFGANGVVSSLETQYQASDLLCSKEVRARLVKLTQLEKFNPASFGMESPVSLYEWQAGGIESCMCEVTALGVSHSGLLDGIGIGHISLESLMANIDRGGDPDYERRSILSLRAEIDRLHSLDVNRSRFCVVELDKSGQVASVKTDDASERLALAIVDRRMKSGGEMGLDVDGSPIPMTYIHGEVDNELVNWHGLMAELSDSAFVRLERQGMQIMDVGVEDPVLELDGRLSMEQVDRMITLINSHYA